MIYRVVLNMGSSARRPYAGRGGLTRQRPASAFLTELKERHDLPEAEFLVDGMGYLTGVL